ncbi:hypothetical protein Tco_1220667 [Tanacetum coccineum]
MKDWRCSFDSTLEQLLYIPLLEKVYQIANNKKNDVKARSLLLMALPNEHHLTFSGYPDAKTMFAAIETRFGGNEATKKTQKTLLKQYTASFSDNAVYDFMVENPNGSNILHQDLEKIHEDDLEAMDLKWQLSLLSMRAKSSETRTHQESKETMKKHILNGKVGYRWCRGLSGVTMAEEQVLTNMALIGVLV